MRKIANEKKGKMKNHMKKKEMYVNCKKVKFIDVKKKKITVRAKM